MIGVACPPASRGQPVQISSPQLSSLCRSTLSWYSNAARSSGGWGRGESFDVVLDDFGNAHAVVWGGPSCQAGDALITAGLTTAPTGTFSTHFRILLPAGTPRSITAAPASEVEDATYSGAVVLFDIEFRQIDAGTKVDVTSAQLSNRCGGHLKWYGADEARLGSGQSVTTTLDDDGNAFVVALAGPSCASGQRLVTADLEAAPYTTVSTHFAIAKPGPAA